MDNRIITSLDIGSTYVRAIVCETDDEGCLKIIGSAVRPSTGLRRGVVVNIEATVRAIKAVIEDAEMMSGLDITDCWVGIGGSHIAALNSRGVVGITGKKRNTRDREIGEEDIERVIEAAKAVQIPADKQILEVIPQQFKVDDQKGIKNPIDMIGVRLESDVHIITCTATGAQNLIKCVNRAGLRVNDLILQTLSAGRAILTPEEMELGVVLIDIGGGTTDTLIYVDGSPYSTFSIPVGGTQVTSDISIVKNISAENAEKIKIESGCCWETMMDGKETVLIPGVGGRPPMSIPRSHILTIIKPRMEEIFKMVKQHIDTLNLLRPLGGGVVITGGGCQLAGTVELANSILKLPARLGSPLQRPEFSGLVEEYRTPSYAAVIGLALEGEKRSGSEINENDSDSRFGEKLNIFRKIGSWIKEFN
ncbi:MAG: cell division protein FtsA [Treponema sp.]|nr:cell division protein FtsA [Treponema sp.]